MSQHSRRRPHRVVVPIAAAVGIGSALVAGVVPTVSAAEGDTVQILSFNDYHGHVEAGTADPFGDPRTGGGEYLSAKLDELRDPTNSFTVAAGDLIGGSPAFSGLFHDEPSVESLNEMGLDYSGVGNHEFDAGVAELIRMQTGGCFDTDDDGMTAGPGDGGSAEAIDDCFFPDAPYQGADFQWLSANTMAGGTTPAQLETDFDAAIPPYEIATDDNGNKIAFIGMTLDGTAELVAEAGLEGYTFQDEVAAAEAAADAVQAEDATVQAMVLMLHEGGFTNTFAINGCDGISGPVATLAAQLDERIDAIVSGHTHQPYTCTLDDPMGDPRPVVSASSFGRVVTELTLTYDGSGDIVREGPGAPVMMNHEVVQGSTNDGGVDADPAVTAVIDKWTPLYETLANTVIGSVTADITRGGDPTGSDRGVESAAGNLVADAQLAATTGIGPGAEIAFMNPGGVRSDLVFAESDAGEGDGNVTFGEAFTFQPFNNTMFVLEMTGAQIQAVLEEQCQPSDQSRPVLHLGVSEGFTYDLAITTQGGVCTGVEVTNMELNDVAIDPATTYNVAVNNFLADGGDSFDTFAEVPSDMRYPGPQDIDALTDYFGANSPVAPPSTDRVNETLTVLPAPAATFAPARLLETRIGDEYVTVDGEFEMERRLGVGETVELVVAGRGGVPADADAVVINVAAIFPDTNGYVTVYDCDAERPLAAGANYQSASVVSNQVVSGVSGAGTVCIFTSSPTDMTVDVNGAVPTGGSPVPVVPARLVETRVGTGLDTVDGEFEGIGPVETGATLEFDVAGRGGVVADAKAVVLNIAAVNPPTNGFLTVYDCEGDLPLAASVNHRAGNVRSNSVTSGISGEGTVCVYASSTTEVVVDVNAYVPVDGSPDPLAPARLLETRIGDGFETVDGEFQGGGQLAGGAEIELVVAGRGGVDDAAVSALLNVAVSSPQDNGYITAYPCDEERPLTAAVNYRSGQVSSNSLIARIGGEGTVCIFASTTTDVIVDVAGAIPPVVPAVPVS